SGSALWTMIGLARRCIRPLVLVGGRRIGQPKKLTRKVVCRLPPIVGMFCQTSAKDAHDRLWQYGAQSCKLRRLRREHCGDHVARAGSIKGALAGEHFVHDAAKGPNIGAPIDMAPLELLRGHIVERSNERAGRRWR